jgi:hypothetical protein
LFAQIFVRPISLTIQIKHLHANKVRKNSVFVPPVYPRNTSGENWGIPIGQKENIAVFFKNTFFIPLATRGIHVKKNIPRLSKRNFLMKTDIEFYVIQKLENILQ